ncbi:MAG TPA: class I SAM-dependent methyltransferase [Rhodothermales bacterium]|nr:class I SAM-dependent methyltransferase [Rhodothermales bacterium]
MREYDQIAEWFTAVRSPEVGIPDLTTFAQFLSPRARILDLGCGDGIPLSQWLLRKGFDLTGLDSSAEMIARYRANFPTVSASCERAQEACFAPRSFEAIVAWGMLFHLSRTDQEAVLEKASGWLKPQGRLLFTAGDLEEVAESEMNGVTFQYTSLGAGAYRRILGSVGMRLEKAYSDAWDNYVYIAVKAA